MLTFDFIKKLGSWLLLGLYVGFFISSPFQGWVVKTLNLAFTPEQIMVGGIFSLITLGLLILVADSVSQPIVENNNLGWLALIGGALWMYFGYFQPIGPIMKKVTEYMSEHVTTGMTNALIIGALIILMGILWFNRNRVLYRFNRRQENASVQH